jgi:MoxR-like ATPase
LEKNVFAQEVAMGAPALAKTGSLLTSENLADFRKFEQQIATFIGRKPDVTRTIMCALLSGGHILIEDVPGVGKTTLIKAMAQLLDLTVSRIQFTSDLMPSDVIGVEVFDTQANSFRFHKGPIFSNIVIADELNRASPRTQSALLEAMGEGAVTVDRDSFPLSKPFLVFASQNPSDNIGTYEIPESQLDRFSAKISLGYPDDAHEAEIFQTAELNPLRNLKGQGFSPDLLQSIHDHLASIHVSDETVNYVKRFVNASRSNPDFRLGISTRGGLMWIRMAKGHAILDGREFVIPDDLQALAVNCLSHRVVVKPGLVAANEIQKLLSTVNVR